MSSGTCRSEDSIEVVGRRGEALIVVRLSAESGDDHVVSCTSSLKRERAQQEQQDARHTIPHLRRSIHSMRGSPKMTRKTIGTSQSSFVLRIEMPASE